MASGRKCRRARLTHTGLPKDTLYYGGTRLEDTCIPSERHIHLIELGDLNRVRIRIYRNTESRLLKVNGFDYNRELPCLKQGLL